MMLTYGNDKGEFCFYKSLIYLGELIQCKNSQNKLVKIMTMLTDS